MQKLVLILSLLALGACGTIEGFGRDISSGARTVERMF